MTRILPRSNDEARRLRRLKVVLLESTPSDEEILQRFQQRARARQRPRSKRRIALFLGLVFGPLFGTLAWAVQTGRIEAGILDPRAQTVLAPPPAGSAKTPPLTEDARKSDLPAAPDRTSEPPPALTPSSRSSAATVRARESRDSTEPGPRLDKGISPPPVAASAVPTSEQADQVWVEVAALMQSGRYQEAQRALGPLLNTGDTRARQAATLLEIQLAIFSQARIVSERERKQLEQLATSGVSAGLRRSARRLLDQLPSHPHP